MDPQQQQMLQAIAGRPAPIQAPPAGIPIGQSPGMPLTPQASQQIQRIAPPSGNLITPQAPMGQMSNMMQQQPGHSYTSQEARDIMNQAGQMKPWTAPTPQQLSRCSRCTARCWVDHHCRRRPRNQTQFFT